MFAELPTVPEAFSHWRWEDLEPYYRELQRRPVSAESVATWLGDWSRLSEVVHELYTRLYLATAQDTTDKAAKARFHRFLEEDYPQVEEAEQRLKEKLLASGLEPEGFAIPLKQMRTDAALFREANLPLRAEVQKLGNRYDEIIGAQTVTWEGEERTLAQMRPVLQDPQRDRRERAWRLMAERQLADREALNDLWVKMLDRRLRMAHNADFPDYRAYRWQQLHRYDYTPEDAKAFHQAIEQVIVPAAARMYEKRRRLLGVERLRPWDLDVDPFGKPPLRPFRTIEELQSKTSAIFHHVDPVLGQYYDIMRTEGLLDLDNRKGKAPGGFCTSLAVSKRPFIFMNAVGTHDDVQTMLHESGHAFHVFEHARLPYYPQRDAPMEFAEVASMAMELLAAPYLDETHGGFYTPADAARARLAHLERSLRFWPYMAVVDAFQHWVYENPDAAHDPQACDRAWADLWRRFMVGVDWEGLEEVMVTGWQRKLHIFQVPFYYIEYGLAQLGAVQVWANALRDQAGAVAAYRRALALGNTAPLPELYATAGARFAFDAATLEQAADLMLRVIDELEAQALG